jgi:hypothetical protein
MLFFLTLMEATRHSRLDSRPLDIFLLLMGGSNNEFVAAS